MRQDRAWSEALLKLVASLNNFQFENENSCKKPGHEECVSFYIGGHRVGVVPGDVVKELANYPDVFNIVDADAAKNSGKAVELHERLSTVEERSKAIDEVLQDLRKKDKFVTLRGWRNEMYGVYFRLQEPPLCHVERAGCSLFGFIQYGVHINGYTHTDGQVMMWVGRRSKTKQTFPDMLDNMCAGGLGSDLGVRECAIKECQEEASVDDETLKNLKHVGSLSYCYTDERGILPETQYLFDLEVSPDFIPQSADGEMQNFNLHTLEEVQNLIISGEFKPNCALVIVDFMFRHGYITPDTEPNYCYIIQRMHIATSPTL